MDCRCRKCGHKWKSRRNKKPKSCVACKSYTWETKSRGKDAAIDGIVAFDCTKCGKKFENGDTIYHMCEGRNMNGVFVVEHDEQQGIYCEDCAPPPEELPFLSDKKEVKK